MNLPRHPRHLPLLLSVMLALIAPQAVRAQEYPGKPAPVPATSAAASSPTQVAQNVDTRPDTPGQQSRQWLRAQAERELASPNRQTLTGPAMRAVHDRYVSSFATPREPTSFRNRDQIR